MRKKKKIVTIEDHIINESVEVIYDFYDKLKSITQGYGSFDYDLGNYLESELVKLDILVNGEKVDTTDMPDMHISTYSLAETFDVGRDTGTQVDSSYEGGVFTYSGELDRVFITLTD